MPLYVEVTAHAVDQLQARYPEHSAVPVFLLRRLIASEVDDAIREQRMATRVPRWAHDESFSRGKGKNGREVARYLRYIWNRGRTRVYLIDRKQAHVTVITTIRPPAPLRDESRTC